MYSEYTVVSTLGWGLLRLSPQSQSRYTKLIDEYYPNVEYYYPRYEVEVRPHGVRKVIRVLRPVYPGYVFMRQGVEGITKLPVRAYWVRFGGEIERVSDRVIERIRELEGSGELVREVRNECLYRAGVRVYIRLGIGDLVGVVCRMVGENRALVDVSVGKCWVPIHRLEPV